MVSTFKWMDHSDVSFHKFLWLVIRLDMYIETYTNVEADPKKKEKKETIICACKRVLSFKSLVQWQTVGLSYTLFLPPVSLNL